MRKGHDMQCESELTSHGYTPCRCEERAKAMPDEPKPKRARIEVNYDVNPSLPCVIDSYMHCQRCLEEWQTQDDPTTGQPIRATQSPKDYARTQIGITNTGGLQVWCNRHECNVAVLTFDLIH